VAGNLPSSGLRGSAQDGLTGQPGGAGRSPIAILQKDWDRHVCDADELSHRPGFQQLRDEILDRAKPSAGDRAVAIGTGTGLAALPLAERVSSVWAIDISAAMIEHARSGARGRADKPPPAGGFGNLPPAWG
jgi:SAM-dependent methyltransferase